MAYEANKDETYYDTRQLDRNKEWLESASDVEKAARMIFLNRTCYNGLYRVNSKGQFNTPIGRYHNPLICDEKNITEIHDYLRKNNIKIRNESYEKIIKLAKDGDIVYVDPPYDYEDDDGFTKYQLQGFTFEDFKKLKSLCDEAIDRGAIVIISNNATEKVIQLFEQDTRYKIGYYAERINSFRNINSDGNDRRSGKEVIVLGVVDSVQFPQADSVEKLIKILQMNEFEIKSTATIAERLNFDTRQSSYYLAALKFLGLVDSKKNFTEKAIDIKSRPELLTKNLHKILLTNQLIFDLYVKAKRGSSSSENEIINMIIKESGKDISNSTAYRRAHTLNSWVKWLIQSESNI